MSGTFIYALVDPRDGRVKYVGKADDLAARLRGHLREARYGGNTHKCRWLRKLASLDLEPTIIMLEEVASDAWQEAEQRWIAHFGRHTLVNGTDGGDGLHNPSVETRAKMRTGRPRSAATNAKISLALRGRPGKPMSEEQRAKRRGKPSVHKGVPMSEEQKAKIGAKLKGKPSHQSAGGMTRVQIVAELRERGYTGRVSHPVARLFSILEEVRNASDVLAHR